MPAEGSGWRCVEPPVELSTANTVRFGGGELTFAEAIVKGEVARFPVIPGGGVGLKPTFSANRSPSPSLAKCLDRRPRALDVDRRPQDRQIDPGVAVFREPLAAARQRAHQADSVENTIAESRLGAALLGEIRFGSKAARAQQPPEKRQVGE